MDASRRTLTLRRVATTASLATLLLVPGTADAKKSKVKAPVITSVSPMEATVGQKLKIKGRNFRKGKGKNSVGFKRSGAAVVFIKSDVSTKKTLYVKLSAKLEKVLYGGTPAVFKLRVLTKRFGRSYTSKKLSPTIAPRPPKPDEATPGETATPAPGDATTPPPAGEAPAFDPAGPLGDCDGDTKLNKDETGDIDNDLLSDALEETIGTDGCKADSDDDGVIDSYEYKSAIDLNDDEYQSPQTALPYPGKRPYPNPLNADSDRDYDGDSLTLIEELSLWFKLGGVAPGETYETFATKPLSYSDGLQYSVYTLDGSGHRVPSLALAGYDKQASFLSWAGTHGYGAVTPPFESQWTTVSTSATDIRDVNRDGTVSNGCNEEATYLDFDCNGFLADDERDEDADGLSNYDETHGRMTPEYWGACYTAEAPYKIPYAGTDVTDPDTDGDGILDGADDQDHDDLPNLLEISRMEASKAPGRPDGHNDTNGRQCTPADGLDPKIPNHPDDYGKVQPFDPCDPAITSRTCDRHPVIGAEPDPNWWALQ